jgi:hypothetical protein
MQEEIEDTFMDIDDQGPRDYETLKDVGVREFSSFVYGYSMTIEYDDKPRIRKICSEGVGSGGSSKKRGVSELRQHIASETEPLAEVNIYEKSLTYNAQMKTIISPPHMIL